MSANSDTPLIDRLKKELKDRDKSVVDFEAETGIDKDKVYKWLKRGVSKIDHVEATKIENWINRQMSNSEDSTSQNSDLKKLIDANHMLAQSVLIDARNRENLTESNRELTKKVTANAQSQNEQAVDAMRSAFLELLSQVGSGKHFHSAEELKTAYRKLVSVALVPEGEGDTRNNLDKKRIVK